MLLQTKHYQKLFKVKGGHSYWQDNAGRILVADDSMRLEDDPTTTDDGLLELNTDGHIVMQEYISGNLMMFAPLKHGRGNMIISMLEASKLILGFGMTVETRLPKCYDVVFRAIAEGMP